MNYSTQTARVEKRMEMIVRHLIAEHISISTMESCTSGLLASAITDTEGASAVFQGAFVTYSNEAKIQQGVPGALIERYGVYSLSVAEAMAEACREAYGAELGVGVTGTTGNPDPANGDSVPGEIYYAILWKEKKCLRGLKLETAELSRHEIKESIVFRIAESMAELLGI